MTQPNEGFGPTCADCGKLNCGFQNSEYPGFCLTTALSEGELEAANACYDNENNREVLVAAAQTEYENYGTKTRVEETMEFANRLGFRKIGIATCIGLLGESRRLTQILRANDFEVFSVACKVGATPKTSLGIPAACEAVGKTTCNPILQAKYLNKMGTQLNIVMGLCVGHDALFYKHSDALVTTLVAKDRVTGHNPVAPLYTLESYYARLKRPKQGK